MNVLVYLSFVFFYDSFKGKGLMETFWLEGRQDMSEANETMVCLWRPQKKNTQKTKQKSVSTDTNTNSNSNQTRLGIQDSDQFPVNNNEVNNHNEHFNTSEHKASSSGSHKGDISMII